MGCAIGKFTQLVTGLGQPRAFHLAGGETRATPLHDGPENEQAFEQQREQRQRPEPDLKAINPRHGCMCIGLVQRHHFVQQMEQFCGCFGENRQRGFVQDPVIRDLPCLGHIVANLLI